jgi:hypothetical protein
MFEGCKKHLRKVGPSYKQTTILLYMKHFFFRGLLKDAFSNEIIQSRMLDE